jgi:ComF family protein
MNPMEVRFAGKVRFDYATAAYFYARTSPMATLVHDFKYKGTGKLAKYMGYLMAEELFPSGAFTGIDYILPIPLHWTKKMHRGYNQAELLCRGISEYTHIPVSTALVAVKAHQTQTGKTLEQRRSNTAGIFAVHKPEKLENKSIIIVDDVCTTGATLLSAAETIERYVPSAKVSLMALCATT